MYLTTRQLFIIVQTIDSINFYEFPSVLFSAYSVIA